MRGEHLRMLAKSLWRGRNAYQGFARAAQRRHLRSVIQSLRAESVYRALRGASK